MERHRGIWPICVQCRVLRVSVSGFPQRPGSTPADRRALVPERCGAAEAHQRRVCGTSRSLRVAAHLAGTGGRGIRVGKQRGRG